MQGESHRPCCDGARIASDRGSATVEWTLVAALLSLLFLAVLQVAFALHIRTTLIDAAAEGARAAGLYGASAGSGAERTRELITAAIASNYAESITVERGTELVTVTVRAPLPLLGVIGPAEGIEVQAHAPVE